MRRSKSNRNLRYWKKVTWRWRRVSDRERDRDMNRCVSLTAPFSPCYPEKSIRLRLVCESFAKTCKPLVARQLFISKIGTEKIDYERERAEVCKLCCAVGPFREGWMACFEQQFQVNRKRRGKATELNLKCCNCGWPSGRRDCNVGSHASWLTLCFLSSKEGSDKWKMALKWPRNKSWYGGKSLYQSFSNQDMLIMFQWLHHWFLIHSFLSASPITVLSYYYTSLSSKKKRKISPCNYE